MIDGHYPVRELWERARSCWTKILAHDSRSVLVVAHNAVNQALVATAIGTGFSLWGNFDDEKKRSNFVNLNNMLSFSSIPNNQVWGPSISEHYFRAIVVLVCWISSQDLRVDLRKFALTA